jgi:hypothetical protein
MAVSALKLCHCISTCHTSHRIGGAGTVQRIVLIDEISGITNNRRTPGRSAASRFAR